MAFGPSLTHRVPFERSKKRLIVFIVNQMFKMYFKVGGTVCLSPESMWFPSPCLTRVALQLNTLSGAKKLAERVASMAKRRTVPLERYPIGEQVVFLLRKETMPQLSSFGCR